VRRAGNRIRVTAQLITATDGSHLWSERYDRELADVFEVQDEISAAISTALKVRLTQAATPRHTPTLPAYEALLKARHFHWKATLQSMDQAKVFYEQAIALDPMFALVHVLYADFLFGRTTMGTPLRDAASESRALAPRALELEPGSFWTSSRLAINYAARGMLADALPLAETSFSLAPWYGPTVVVLAGLQVRMGQSGRAREVLATLGPDKTYGVALSRALFHTCCGEIDLAADWYEKAIEERDSRVPIILQAVIGESIRRSSRWPGLAARVNLNEASSQSAS
jgi:tetratricopeptide (TPR) repeat protein